MSLDLTSRLADAQPVLPHANHIGESHVVLDAIATARTTGVAA
jgi:hypothetical protein